MSGLREDFHTLGWRVLSGMPKRYADGRILLSQRLADLLPAHARLSPEDARETVTHFERPLSDVSYFRSAAGFSEILLYQRDLETELRWRNFWALSRPLGAAEAELVGLISVGSPAGPFQCAASRALTVGYYVMPSHRGHHHARAMLDNVVGQLRTSGLDYLCAETNPGNHASVRSLQAAGFCELASGPTSTLPPGGRIEAVSRRFVYRLNPVAALDWPYRPG